MASNSYVNIKQMNIMEYKKRLILANETNSSPQGQDNKDLQKNKIKRRQRKRNKNVKVETDSSSSCKVDIEEIGPLSSLQEDKSNVNSRKKKKNKVLKKDCFEKINYTFTIKPVKNNKAGRFIRQKDPNSKFVNLKSFIKVTKCPCVFSTSSQLSLAKSFNKLTLDNKPETKVKIRKYPVKSQSSTPKKSKKEESNFPDYLNIDEVKVGLEEGELIKGFLRVNPKNANNSYVSNEDTSQADYYITSILDRNRAFDGDEVILRVKPEVEWSEGKKTARIVFINRKIHPRIAVGTLKTPERRTNKIDYAVLYPRDKKLPTFKIASVSLPNGFAEHSSLYENNLFLAKITEWSKPSEAHGVLLENLGLSGDLRVECLSIIREFGLDITPFPIDILSDSLLKSKEIDTKELEYREDLRKECVFTIDPATARDLDDAVSCKELENGNLEIGVHISDASYFLDEGSELDQMVCKKATTIYLVSQVYHMLPVELCLHCSLLPGEDKLAFSVFWKMTPEGKIISRRFARSVVNSCTKLAYEHAQMIIENPEKVFPESDFPVIHNGFKVTDIIKTVNCLQKIAVNLREERNQNGALRIDQAKLSFSLDPVNEEPLDFWKYENKESHRLIEEFMLLANITVAEKISESYPDLAFLRCHEPPKQTMMFELQNNLATCGIHIDISSSGGISNSLKKYITDDFAGFCRGMVLNHIIAKTMTRARYFCASTMDSESEYKHYALSVPIYTHFTSPIRRYADIMVHRLLAASLGYQKKPEWEIDYVSNVAANCNAQKYNAKKAGEASNELYLAHFIEKHKPEGRDCVVADVKDRSFDVIVLSTGSIVRIYQNSCENGTTWKTEAIPTVKETDPENNHLKTNSNPKKEHEKKLLKLTITFPKTKLYPAASLIVELFTLVKVKLERKQNSYKLDGKLLRPVPSVTFASNG